jgi:GTP diphosphokinase / guanosine-3',5'-bis(diphosphate) 3'-diphosphatase
VRSNGGEAPKLGGYNEVVAVLERHQDLVDELLAEVEAYKPDVDRELLTRAFDYAAQAHSGQLRQSGQEFIYHPWGVAKILAGLQLDEATLAAALLHDVVEDTSTDIEELRAEFGDEVANLVEGVTKLTRVKFQSREHAEAENYRKLIVAMAEDLRVILIKLADRLHNLRTIEYLGKQKQLQKARETLEVYAPLAHRLGIHALKWELEDLAFQTLHPRKYEEIKQMVAERRTDREELVREAAMVLQKELDKVDVPADISGRAKHFFSIYDKMAKKGREFNEIYDLTAMRVIAERTGDEGTRDCYGALGLIHSLWKPMPGRFKDYVAMPKFNGYRALHTTVIGPQGRPLEIQVRTRDMHETAEYGVAAHWLYKKGKKEKDRDAEWVAWVKQLMDEGTTDEADPREFMKTFRTDLFEDEVHVFTPKGQVKTLPAGATPIDFAYAVHTDVGHRTVGAKINGRIVPLHYQLKNGDFVEILTSKQGRGPSRDWMSLAKSSRARNKIRQWFSRETREDAEAKGRESLEHALKAQNLPYAKLRGSATLAQVIRETGFKKAEDFYLALGSGKLQAGGVVNKVVQRLKTEQVAEEAPVVTKAAKTQPVSGSDMGIIVPGVTDVLVRLAKCCTPVPGDPILGYISLGRGITIHREDCPNVKALKRSPERFTPVSWDGAATSTSFRVQIAVDSWDRPRLLEDVARTFAEHGANIVSYGGTVEDQLAKNWYTVEVGDVKGLRTLLTALRNLDAVFDAYRMTPS